MKLIDYSIEELGSMHYACSCGKTHYIGIEHVAIGKGAISRLPEFLATQKLAGGRTISREDPILVVSDVNTWKAAGAQVVSLIADAGYTVSSYTFPYKKMHTEEKYIKELQEAMADDVCLMIAVGSGTMNDITRYVSFGRKIPYYIVGTAPSMDGYASDVSPVIINNLKVSLPAHCAAAIIGDTDILATAPEKMIAAGVGDIMAKFLDINDWRMSRIINGEDYCDEVAELMLYSTEKCVENIDGLVRRDGDALQCLMESLVLIGIAMAYVGSSRPGSAAEHSMAHVMEMTSLLAGDYGELHGTCVGMATCVITRLYEKFLQKPIDYAKAKRHADAFSYEEWVREMNRFYTKAAQPVIDLYDKQKRNDPSNVKKRLQAIREHEGELLPLIRETVEKSKRAEGCIQALHGWTSPVQFGFTREHMRDIILYSKEQRDRYAALQFLYEVGELEELTDELLDEYYAG